MSDSKEPKPRLLSDELRLFVLICSDDPNRPGGWHPALCYGDRKTVEAVHAFTSADDAWSFLGIGVNGPEHDRAMYNSWRVVELIRG